ncbi:MAG: hypothetical protein KatS3mg101_0022 [Patescibacteria group bacterium]|nr:MAG: hypothetical protein KatS3mg101_0022 [Patescibacteria group bacterium]
MNAVEISTIILLIVLTVCVASVSIYLILLLKDLRKTAQDADKVVNDVGRLTGSIGGPLAAAAGFLENVARGTKAFKVISSIFEKKEEK